MKTAGKILIGFLIATMLFVATGKKEITIIMDQTQSDKLIRDVSDLQRQVADLQVKVSDNKAFEGNSEKITDEFLRNKILDIFWKRIFHYFTYFESLDGSFQDLVGAASNISNNTGQALEFETDVHTNDYAALLKMPMAQNLLSFDSQSRFRTGIIFSHKTKQEIFIHVGDNGMGYGSVLGYYGFKVVDGILYGETNNYSSSTTLKLKTIDTAVRYELEARYYPGERAMFFVDGEEMGIITATLPLPTIGGINRDLFQIEIKTTENATKAMTLSFLEYIQERNRLK